MKTLLIITAYIAPFVFIPAVFRFAGGVLGNLSGMVNNRAKGVFDRQRKYRGEERKAKGKDAQSGNRWRGGKGPTYDGNGNMISRGNLRGRMNSQIGYLSKTGAAGFAVNRETRRARMQSAESAHMSQDVNELAESDAMKALAGNEDLLQAGSHVGTDGMQGTDSSIREYLRSRGQSGQLLEQNTAAVRNAVREKSQIAYNAMSSVMTAGTGTGYAGGQGEMMAAINQAAGSDRALAGRLLNMARGQAEKANRPDLQGSGFGESLTALEDQYSAGDTAAAQATTTQGMDLAVLRSKGINVVANSRNNQLSRLAPALGTAFEDAMNRGDEAGATEIASQITALRSSLNAGTSAENRQVSNDLFERVGIDLTAAQSVDEQLGTMVETHINPPRRTMPSGPLTQTIADPLDTSATPRLIVVNTAEGDRMANEEATANAAVAARTNEIRARAGLYDQGTRGMVDPTVRAGGPPPPPGGPPPPVTSDRRLKRNIEVAGQVKDITLYKFQYLWSDQVYIGVMAQDLLTTYPDAVITDSYGYYKVDYAKLELEMLKLEDWEAKATQIVTV